MTDRYHSLTVVLEHDLREDDAEPLMNAIKMLKGVIDVSGNVTDIITLTAQARARSEIGVKLLDIFYPKKERKE